jgi:hypothetical protein
MKNGLVVRSESINDMGFTVGFGLPITGFLIMWILVLKWEKKRYTNAGLIKGKLCEF